jgi:hypothetical protein
VPELDRPGLAGHRGRLQARLVADVEAHVHLRKANNQSNKHWQAYYNTFQTHVVDGRAKAEPFQEL